MNMTETLIESWEHFAELVHGRPWREWVYRGQGNAEWPLATNIERLFTELAGLVKLSGEQRRFHRPAHERNLIEEFKAYAHLSGEPLPTADADDLEWLHIMQHHGAPTRLLDVSVSPWVAAFFAIENGAAQSCVYAIHAQALYHKHTRAQEDPRTMLFKKGRKKQRLLVWEPRHVSARLAAQQGLFLVPTDLQATVAEHAQHYETVGERFIIPEDLRLDGLRRLRAMNITNRTLFPGLDGLCRSLRHQPLEINKRLNRKN